ncbi:MAG: hypothetical protein DDT41_01223 [candidate division WS2 bacterium]|nr:hypothetical protein [Candidatus Psychracetigena formicireducens]
MKKFPLVMCLTTVKRSDIKLDEHLKAIFYFKDLVDIDKEIVCVAHLNSAHELIEREIISIGSTTASITHPNHIFKKVIENGTIFMLVVHNHPTGDPTPSPEDLKIMKLFNYIAKKIHITILDNVVVGKQGFYSHKYKKIFQWDKMEEFMCKSDAEI